MRIGSNNRLESSLHKRQLRFSKPKAPDRGLQTAAELPKNLCRQVFNSSEQSLTSLLKSIRAGKSTIDDFQKALAQYLLEPLKNLSLPITGAWTDPAYRRKIHKDEVERNKAVLEKFCIHANQIAQIIINTFHDKITRDELLDFIDKFYINFLNDEKVFPHCHDPEQVFISLTSRARNPSYLLQDFGTGDFDPGFEIFPKIDLKPVDQEALAVIDDFFSPIKLRISKLPWQYCLTGDIDEGTAACVEQSNIPYIDQSYIKILSNTFGKWFHPNEIIAHEMTHVLLDNLGLDGEDLKSPEENHIVINKQEFIANAVGMQISPLVVLSMLLINSESFNSPCSGYLLVAQAAKDWTTQFLYQRYRLDLNDLMHEISSSIDTDNEIDGRSTSPDVDECGKAFQTALLNNIGEDGMEALARFMKMKFKTEAQKMIKKLYDSNSFSRSKLEALKNLALAT